MPIKLEVGKSYTRADGSVHRIVGHTPDLRYTFQAEDGHVYTPDGDWSFRPNNWDLIAEVPAPFEIVPGGVYCTYTSHRMRVYAVDGAGEYPIHGATEFPTGWHVGVYKPNQIIGPWVDKPRNIEIEQWAMVNTNDGHIHPMYSLFSSEQEARNHQRQMLDEWGWTVVKLTGTVEVKP